MLNLYNALIKNFMLPKKDAERLWWLLNWPCERIVLFQLLNMFINGNNYLEKLIKIYGKL